MKKDFEIKWCVRCFIDGFILENMWPDGQTGEIATIDARVCSGGDDWWDLHHKRHADDRHVSDIIASNGIFRNSSGGLTLSPRSGGPGDGGGVSQGSNRILYLNLLFYNFDQNEFGGSKGGEAFIYGAKGNTFVNCTGVRALVYSSTLDRHRDLSFVGAARSHRTR